MEDEKLRAGEAAWGEGPDVEKASGREGAPAEKAPKAEYANITRRTLVIGLGSTAALLGLGALRYAGHNPLVHPPGGQDEAHLVNACIRCERCLEACPRKVIVPAHIEDGLLGMRAPMLNFSENYCDFCAESNDGQPRCLAVCPTSALSLADEQLTERTILTTSDGGEQDKSTTVKTPNLGLAVIDKTTCLAFRDTGCRFCYDACPLEPKAIELYGGTDASEGSDGTNPRVRVIRDNCNGCGACESVCVSLKAASIATGATERAIVVRPLELVDEEGNYEA